MAKSFQGPTCDQQLKSHYKCQNANLNKTTGYNANEKGEARRSSGKR